MYVREKTTQHRAHAVCVSSLQSQCLLFQFDKIRSKQVSTKSPMNHRGSPAHKDTSQRHRPQLAGKNPNCSSPIASTANNLIGRRLVTRIEKMASRTEIGILGIPWPYFTGYHSCAWSYWHRMADCTQSKVPLCRVTKCQIADATVGVCHLVVTLGRGLCLGSTWCGTPEPDLPLATPRITWGSPQKKKQNLSWHIESFAAMNLSEQQIHVWRTIAEKKHSEIFLKSSSGPIFFLKRLLLTPSSDNPFDEITNHPITQHNQSAPVWFDVLSRIGTR